MFRRNQRQKNQRQKNRKNSSTRTLTSSLGLRRTHLSLEQLESRIVLSSNPVLSVAGDQTVDEGALLNLTDIAVFSDEVVGAGGASIGLNPDDYASLGAFDPTANVVIDTDALTIDGVGVAATTVSLDTGSGAYDVAVFTFDSFELDAGLTLTGTGSLPLAILSQGDLSVLGTIDVSAFAEFPVTTASGYVHGERLAGAGGGDGASVVQGAPFTFHGEAAVGSPTALGVQGFGRGFIGLRGAGGAGFGGNGGIGIDGTVLKNGFAYGDLSLGIQGGSGGGGIKFSGSGSVDGGGGGGGIELGANGTITISGSVLAVGGDSGQASLLGGGAGAGGGILVHAFNVDVSGGTLNANGGNSDIDLFQSNAAVGDEGGAGGGGRVLLSYDSTGTFNDSGSSISVSAGIDGLVVPQTAADDGVFSVVPVTSTPVVETYDYVINWGDGSTTDLGTPDVDVLGASGIDHEGSFDGSHTYSDDGVFTVTVTVNDSGGGTATEAFDVTVDNVAPTLTLAGVANSDEGAGYTLNFSSSDPGDDTIAQWDVDWGDGSLETILGDPSLATHTYVDGNNNYTISATATDEDGTFAAGNTVDVTVANLVPVILNLSTDSSAVGDLGEGDTVTLSADFTDAGLIDTHTATIDWGDGTTSVGVVNQTTGMVSADHAYANGGTFEVTLTLVDNDSGAAIDTTGTVIAGVGLNNGVLQIIGTNDNDFVKVYKSWCSGDMKVLSRIGGGPIQWETFDSSNVDEIEIILGGGHDLGFVSRRIHVDATLDGGDGDDLLFGGSGNDVLLGGAGHDVLIGRRGRDLMIGGTGSDFILGNSGEDILVAGTTAFDNNSAARDAIMAEWTSSSDYATRVANITNTGVGVDFDDRLNEDYFLIASGVDATVFDDEATDLLIGGRGLDLYFANLDGGVEDIAIGLRNSEVLEELEEAGV